MTSVAAGRRETVTRTVARTCANSISLSMNWGDPQAAI